MAVTQKDIAKRLNISTSSVTKVLNGSKVWISPEKRERILSTAAEMNYHVNPAARALVNGRYDTISLAYIRPVGYARTEFSLACEILAERLGEIGYELKLKVLPDNESLVNCMNQMAARRDMDAVVLLGNDDELEEHGLFLARNNVPFVIKGRFENDHPEWCQVDYDHEQMMRTAIEHVVALGHRKLAYLGFETSSKFASRLLDGYRQGMDSVGLPVRQDWIAHTDEFAESAERVMSKWLEMPEDERPTAVIIASGNYAWYGVERSLGRKGILIGDGPNDFTVAGMCVGSLSLSFGQAMAYQEISFGGIASAMFDKLLTPMLMRQDKPSPIVRVSPELTPVNSLNALDYANFRTHSNVKQEGANHV